MHDISAAALSNVMLKFLEGLQLHCELISMKSAKV